jgi:hypothetical protein
MPIVGSSAYNTAGQVTALIRSLLNDAAGNLFTDGLLMPYVNSAYRKVQRALAAAGQETFLVDDILLTVPAIAQIDASQQVVVNDATAPPNQLPTDLLAPLEVWERAAGSQNDFVQMTDLTGRGGLPSLQQGAALRFWEWREDGLWFLGATQDTQIRVRYQKSFPDFSDGTSIVLIRNAQEAIAYTGAAMAALARGSPLADKWSEAGADALEDLITTTVRRDQRAARRRQPFSARTALL